MLRDFNEILAHKEKCGRRLHLEWQLIDFKGALTDCELCDLGFSRN